MSLCLPCCPSSFIAPCQPCLWEVPRAVTLVIFILSVPTSAQNGSVKAGFTAYCPAKLLLAQELLLLGSSSFRNLHGLCYLLCLHNTLHCEVWSSHGHLGNSYMLELNPFYWRRKSDKIKRLAHVFEGCSPFSPRQLCLARPAQVSHAAEQDGGAFRCPWTRSDVGLTTPSCPGLQ